MRAKPSSYVSAAAAEVTILSANENNYGREIPRAQTSATNSPRIDWCVAEPGSQFFDSMTFSGEGIYKSQGSARSKFPCQGHDPHQGAKPSQPDSNVAS